MKQNASAFLLLQPKSPESHDLKFFGCTSMPGMVIIIIKEDEDIGLFYSGNSKVNVGH